MRIAHVLILLLTALQSNLANAQTQVWVDASAEDPVGRQLAFELREGIRRSAAMNLADRAQDGRIAVKLVTLDPDKSSGGGNRTIYSAVWTMQTFHQVPVEMFLANYVGLCGLQRTSSCAQGLVVITDEQVTDLRKMLKDASDSQRRAK